MKGGYIYSYRDYKPTNITGGAPPCIIHPSNDGWFSRTKKHHPSPWWESFPTTQRGDAAQPRGKKPSRRPQRQSQRPVEDLHKFAWSERAECASRTCKKPRPALEEPSSSRKVGLHVFWEHDLIFSWNHHDLAEFHTLKYEFRPTTRGIWCNSTRFMETPIYSGGICQIFDTFYIGDRRCSNDSRKGCRISGVHFKECSPDKKILVLGIDVDYIVYIQHQPMDRYSGYGHFKMDRIWGFYS